MRHQQLHSGTEPPRQLPRLHGYTVPARTYSGAGEVTEPAVPLPKEEISLLRCARHAMPFRHTKEKRRGVLLAAPRPLGVYLYHNPAKCPEHEQGSNGEHFRHSTSMVSARHAYYCSVRAKASLGSALSIYDRTHG